MANKGKHTAPTDQKGSAKPFLQRMAMLLLMLAVVLTVAVLTTMEDGVHFAPLRRWLTYGDSNATRDFHTYTADPGNLYAPLGDGLLVVNTNTIRFMQDSSAPVYEHSVRLKTPQLSVGTRQAAVCDVGGDSLYILDPSGIRRTLSAEHGLCFFSARLNSSDYLAVTEQKSGYKASVAVYNSSGELVFQFDSHDNYISDALVTDDCRYVVAVSLESQSGVFASKLLVHDLASAELVNGQTVRDGLVLDFNCVQDRVLSLCDTRFAITSLSGETLLDYAYGNLYLHDYALTGKDFCALLLGRYQSGNICTLKTFDLNGKELASLDLTEEVLDISAAGDYLAVLYDDSLSVYDRSLTERTHLTDTNYAGQIQMASDGTVLVISSTSAWRFLP